MKLVHLMLASGLSCAILYVIKKYIKKKRIILQDSLECLAAGAGVLGGLYLIVGSFFPRNLVRTFDPAGNKAANVVVDMDADVCLCIMVGGFSMTFLAVATLWYKLK